MKSSKSFSTGKVDAGRAMSMRLGLAAWGFRESALERQLQITKRLGVRLLEFSISGQPNDALKTGASPEDIRQVRELFAKYGVELSCAAGGNDFTLPDADANLQQLDALKRTIDLAHELGVSHLRIFAGFSPLAEVTGQRWDLMIDCLRQTLDYAKPSGVIPVVETHGGVAGFPEGVKHSHSASSQPESLLRMLSELPDLQVNFDPANLFAVGIAHPEDVYLRIKSRVAYAHLKDFAQVPGTDYVKPAACGESSMDWRKLLDAMSDFAGPALIEYENTCDVEDGCRRSLNYIANVRRPDSWKKGLSLFS